MYKFVLKYPPSVSTLPIRLLSSKEKLKGYVFPEVVRKSIQALIVSLEKNLVIAYERLKLALDRHLNKENCYEEQLKRLEQMRIQKLKRNQDMSMLKTSAERLLPYFFRGKVVQGFGRGGKLLNCPTANLDSTAVEALPKDFPNGVYAGFARVDDGQIHKMVMSIGMNPQFKNEIKTIEVHILHEFPKDFYNSMIEAIALIYLRPMNSFNSMDELISAIEEDKRTAQFQLDDPKMRKWTDSELFSKI
uniref:riboflavin kinase n=1 Tax=Acrobeloides nanus TaxID=290746 RepID=A0A914ESL0_9BILA